MAAMLALGGLVGTSSLSAQSVTTAPVGAVSKTIPVGLSTLGVALTNPNLVVASCSANTSSVVTLTGVANVGALLVAGQPYYIESVNAGVLEGDRFEVNTAATIAAGNGTVVLDSASPNNTFALTADSAVGTQFALRKHVTLAQIQAACTTALVGSNNSAAADQIQFLNSTGDGFVSYYLRGNGTEWRQVGGTVNLSNTAVPPGTGVIISKNTAPVVIVMTGEVRTNSFALPLPAGLSLRAPAYPVSYSASGLNATVPLGWFGSNNSAVADQLQVLNETGDGFVSYYLRGNGTEWRQVGGTTPVTATSLFSYDSGYFVARLNPDPNYILTRPFSL